MSTNASVYVRLKEEDRNKLLKFNPEIIKEADRDSGKVKREFTPRKDTIIVGAYVHWDGDRIIDHLKEHFNDYERALNLVIGGAMSYIEDDVVRYYSSWRDEEYEVYERNGSSRLKMEYIPCTYLFEDGEWRII